MTTSLRHLRTMIQCVVTGEVAHTEAAVSRLHSCDQQDESDHTKPHRASEATPRQLVQCSQLLRPSRNPNPDPCGHTWAHLEVAASSATKNMHDDSVKVKRLWQHPAISWNGVQAPTALAVSCSQPMAFSPHCTSSSAAGSLSPSIYDIFSRNSSCTLDQR